MLGGDQEAEIEVTEEEIEEEVTDEEEILDQVQEVEEEMIEIVETREETLRAHQEEKIMIREREAIQDTQGTHLREIQFQEKETELMMKSEPGNILTRPGS